MNVEEIMKLTSWDEKLNELTRTDHPLLRRGRNERKIKEWIRFYNNNHPIEKQLDHQDVWVTTYKEDPNTGECLIVDGKPVETGMRLVKKSRLLLPYQQQIVITMETMLVGKAVTLILNNEKKENLTDAFSELQRTWSREIRLDSFNKKLVKQVGIESKACEIFYVDPDEEVPQGGRKTIKVMLLCQECGDVYYPHFNDQRKIDAITRQFQKRDVVDGAVCDVDVTEIYTAKATYVKVGNEEFVEHVNAFNKLCAIYYDQYVPEWENVRTLIERQEESHSQHADVNRRVGNPAIVLNGEVGKMPGSDDGVKVFKIKSGMGPDGKMVSGAVSYLESATSPESVKLEFEMLDNYIYKFSWPDLYYFTTQLKGGDWSGTAIELAFTHVYGKMQDKLAIYEEMFNRRLNVIKHMLSILTNDNTYDKLDVSIQFNPLSPRNILELVQAYQLAVQGQMTSRYNAQSKLPFNDNPDQTYKDTIDEMKVFEGTNKSSSGKDPNVVNTPKPTPVEKVIDPNVQ